MNAIIERAQLRGNITLNKAESFGRIRRPHSPDTASQRNISSGCANRDSALPRDECIVYTLRVFAGSEFSEVGRTAQHARPPRTGLDHRAYARWPISLAQILEGTLRAVGAVVRSMRANWRQRRRARETYFALRGLDDRTLRDLGFDRSEIGSISAEAARDTDYARARSERALRGFY